MRQSTYLCRTLREPPANIEPGGLQMAMRAGVLRPASAGFYAWLPLGHRALARVSHLARTAIESLGAQEMSLPCLYLSEAPTPEQFAVRDRARRQYVLDDGDRAAWLRAIQADIVSYRQLPTMIYRTAALFRDEEHARGLMRGREFTVISSISLHTDSSDLDKFYPRVLDALTEVLRQCQLEAWSVPTEDGHEFLLPHPKGDGMAFTCSTCHYRATSDQARFVKLAASASLPTTLQPFTLQKAATPNCSTIAQVAAFLQVPITQTLKTMMYADDQGRVILAVIRGDLEINAAKLESAVHHTRIPINAHGKLRPATDEQIRAAGAVPGYASPVGLGGVIVIADDSVQSAVGMVAGANEEGYHLTGVNVPRDLKPTVIADIAQAYAGSVCPECSGRLEAVNVIELGGCARMGTALSEAMDVTFLDASGKARPLVLGGYGLGLTRIVAAVLETHHDERGLIWPAAIAPFDAHLIVLGKEPREQAEALYQRLQQAGIRVLYDDRDESPGVKFNDADLIGLPIRVTASKRNMDKDCVEIKARAGGEARIVATEHILDVIRCEQATPRRHGAEVERGG